MKQASHSAPDRYTDPELRDRIKAEITASDKGGKAGQWSARKAQLVAHQYEKEGGGYKHERDEQQQSLKQWGDEHWTTSDGEKAERPGGTTRYLPQQSWDALSPEEKTATNRKKREGSKAGNQFVPNTETAAKARKRASTGKAANPASGTKASAKKASARKPSKSESSTSRHANATRASAKKKSAN